MLTANISNIIQTAQAALEMEFFFLSRWSFYEKGDLICLSVSVGQNNTKSLKCSKHFRKDSVVIPNFWEFLNIPKGWRSQVDSWDFQIAESQVLDYFVASFNHEKSCALMFFPHVAGVCNHSEEDITPFGTGHLRWFSFHSFVDLLFCFSCSPQNFGNLRSQVFDHKIFFKFGVARNWPKTLR